MNSVKSWCLFWRSGKSHRNRLSRAGKTKNKGWNRPWQKLLYLWTHSLSGSLIELKSKPNPALPIASSVRRCIRSGTSSVAVPALSMVSKSLRVSWPNNSTGSERRNAGLAIWIAQSVLISPLSLHWASRITMRCFLHSCWSFRNTIFGPVIKRPMSVPSLFSENCVFGNKSCWTCKLSHRHKQTPISTLPHTHSPVFSKNLFAISGSVICTHQPFSSNRCIDIIIYVSPVSPSGFTVYKPCSTLGIVTCSTILRIGIRVQSKALRSFSTFICGIWRMERGARATLSYST